MDRNLREQYEELLEKVIAGLVDKSYSKIAKSVGLHENTIRSIAFRKNKKPAIETLEMLADYLFGGK